MTGVLCLGLCALLLAGASAERLLLQGSNWPPTLVYIEDLIFCTCLYVGVCLMLPPWWVYV